MLSVFPDWWDDVMVWMDTSTVPLWVIGVALILYLIVTWHTHLRPPPSSDS